MRAGTPEIGAVTRALDFLERIVADCGAHATAQLAGLTDLPPATAHRQVRTLVAHGYLTPIARGRHVAGPRVLRLADAADPIAVLAAAARPMLRRLAIACRGTAHLGILEQDMVTYLVKAGRAGDQMFTEEGKQLEAYCSGIGRALLAQLPEHERERYLADGPFIALTPRTITDPAELRAELAATRIRGFAIDDGEIAREIQCVAVPLIARDGIARAAISLTRTHGRRDPTTVARLAAKLDVVGKGLIAAVFG